MSSTVGAGRSALTIPDHKQVVSIVHGYMCIIFIILRISRKHPCHFLANCRTATDLLLYQRVSVDCNLEWNEYVLRACHFWSY